MRHRIAALSLLTFSVLALTASAQTPPMPAEFQVNTTTTDDQYGYGVVMDQNGNFVVSWESFAQDGSSYGAFGRRFNADGTPATAEFQVNQYTTNDQGYPRIAGDPFGNFVVAWQSYGQDGDGAGIFARRFDHLGAPAGPEFAVNTYTTGYQAQADVAADGGGNFVVVWNSTGQDGDGGGVFAQRFDNSGTRVGSEFKVNAYTTGDQQYPVVAMNGAGDFVVVWVGSGSTSVKGIFARRFDAAGVAQGTEFQVNTATSTDFPAVAMDQAGDFVVAWEGLAAGGSALDVLARRYDATGTALGPEFRVNTYTAGNQESADVAMDPSGNFIVAWESLNQDGDGSGAFGQRFDRFGTLVGVEFPINTYTTGAQTLPRVATSRRGDFVVEWSSLNEDGSNYGVFGRRAAMAAAPSIAVDAHASSGSSNVNGVLEPGETVMVETAWHNSGGAPHAITGTSPDFSGPAGATYTLTDAAADYGSIGAGATRDCHTATGDCYEVSVSNPGARPATHWDVQLQETLSAAAPKTWNLHVGGSFTDVPITQPFYKRIETLLHSGITAGCTGTQYCPSDNVSRGQMALFIGRAIAGNGAAMPPRGTVGGNPYVCGPGGTSLFTDVPPTDSTCRGVHYIASQNVTAGCSPTMYCGANNVTRLEMASFMAKAIVAPQGGPGVPLTYGPDPVTGLSYSCNTGSPNTFFTDVPASNTFCKHVHFLWAKGFITGCGGTLYCPNDPVTRDAMAKFLVASFNLQLYGP
jgi:hypothetical protein